MSEEEKVIVLHNQQFRKYISKKEIKTIVSHLAEQINLDYLGKSVVVLGVLDGVILFLASLIKKLNIDLSLELIKLKSYSGVKSSGNVNQLIGLTGDLKGKHILIVEDIIDTGTTLTFLLEELKGRGAKSIEVVTLLLKDEVFDEKFPIKYVGKKIENKFVVGYGMDHDGSGRQLPEIYVLDES